MFDRDLGGYMTEDAALRTLAKAAGYSLAELSRAAGRSGNYVASLLGRGSSPTLSTTALLAEAAGYSLAFVPRVDLPRSAIVIDSPRPLASSSGE